MKSVIATARKIFSQFFEVGGEFFFGFRFRLFSNLLTNEIAKQCCVCPFIYFGFWNFGKKFAIWFQIS